MEGAGAWDSDPGSDPDVATCLHDLDHVVSPLRTCVFTSGVSH